MWWINYQITNHLSSAAAPVLKQEVWTLSIFSLLIFVSVWGASRNLRLYTNTHFFLYGRTKIKEKGTKTNCASNCIQSASRVPPGSWGLWHITARRRFHFTELSHWWSACRQTTPRWVPWDRKHVSSVSRAKPHFQNNKEHDVHMQLRPQHTLTTICLHTAFNKRNLQLTLTQYAFCVQFD